MESFTNYVMGIRASNKENKFLTDPPKMVGKSTD